MNLTISETYCCDNSSEGGNSVCFNLSDINMFFNEQSMQFCQELELILQNCTQEISNVTNTTEGNATTITNDTTSNDTANANDTAIANETTISNETQGNETI